MTCARCGSGVLKAEDQIIMNKVWHKCCFRCSRCNKVLDKSSAKLFHGEIFCECCHVIALEDFETLLKPCRVVSSPSCICIKKSHHTRHTSRTPSFDYSKKYDICFPQEVKDNITRNIQSCSCIPDVKNKTYCFAFPIPREVANYYNRSGMRKRNRYLSQKCRTNDEKQQPQKIIDHPIKLRTLSPPRKRDSPLRRNSSTDESPPGSPRRCCRPCHKCCRRKKSPERPRPPCCPCPRDNSPPPCRDCKGCCCKEHDMKPRSPSPRRYYPPRRKSPCVCCRCTESPEHPEHTEPPEYTEPLHHTPRQHHKQENSHQNEASRYQNRPEHPHLPDHPHHLEHSHHYPENPCYSENPPRPEPPNIHIQECLYYKDCQCCKDQPRSCKDSPPGYKECPRNCKEYPRNCKECHRSCKGCPPERKESPVNQYVCCPYLPELVRCRCGKPGKKCRCDKPKRFCLCGNPNPCDCKINRIRSECTSVCVRCGCKVYAAEKICVSGGPYHTSCFSCVCCHKLLDVKNVYENAGEIYCKHCYNNLMGNSYYGYT